MSPSTKGQQKNRILVRLLIAMMLLTLTFTTAFAGEIPAAEGEAEGEPVVSEEELQAEPAEEATAPAEEAVTEEPAPAAEAPAVQQTAPKATGELPAWITEDDTTYYLSAEGTPLKDGVFSIKDEETGKTAKYCFDANGALLTGIIKVDSATIYIAAEDGTIYNSGLFTYKGKKYYATSSGKLVLNKVLTVGKKKYMFGKTGAAKTGYIQKNKGIRYIADTKTAVIKTGLITYKGKKYYAPKSGVLVRNTLKKVGKKTYYFGSTGAVVKNTTKTIKGMYYKFGKSGALTKKTPSGSTVAKFAIQFNGNPYRHGGTSLTKGADCSGFVMAVYKHYGINLPHYSYTQQQCGKAVSKPKPGDLVFYYGGGHAALYIGNGKVIHAMNVRDGIKITSINACGHPTSIRRIIGN